MTVDRFALGVYEVTRSEYEAFATATGRGAGAGAADASRRQAVLGRTFGGVLAFTGIRTGRRPPVVCVNWEEAQAYVRWLNAETGQRYRLPSEAEWEYAARAGTTTFRYWGNAPDDGCTYENGLDRTYRGYFDEGGMMDCTDGVLWTSPVGAYEPNAFGLHDMLGNASEWTADCRHDDYEGAPRDGSAWTRDGDCSRREVRGGSWGHSRSLLRSDRRGWTSASTRDNAFGFRVARKLD